MPKIGIVILNWNAANDTIRSVQSALDAGAKELDLVVVDNGSSDSSVEKIKKEFDWITILETGANLGYAGGNNRGLDEVFRRGCDFGLILNNDCIVRNFDFIDDIIANLDKKIAMYGLGISEIDGRGRLEFQNSKKDYYGILFGLVGPVNVALEGNRFVQVGRVSGAAMVVNKQFYESIGCVDERYFLYVEEVDFCFRAKANGWAVVYENANYVSVIHSRKGEYERPYVWYYMFRNMVLFCKFNFDSYRFYFAVTLCLASQLKGFGNALMKKKFEVLKMMLRGIHDGMLGKTGIMR